MPGLGRTAMRVFAPLLAFGLAWAPRAAEACAVCMGGREDENRAAFIGTTVFLSVLPLALIAGIALWLRKRIREVEAARGADPRVGAQHPPESRPVVAGIRAS